MKQAQRVQEDMQKAQNEIADLEVTGESGAGLVKVTMTGRRDVKKVVVELEVIGQDKSMLEDLIAAAVNDANRRMENTIREKMLAFTGDSKLLGALKSPFPF